MIARREPASGTLSIEEALSRSSEGPRLLGVRKRQNPRQGAVPRVQHALASHDAESKLLPWNVLQAPVVCAL